MKKSIIAIDPATIRPGLGPCTGSIWMELESEAFPMPRWNDFIIVILEAFAGALVRLLRGTSALERVHFMEGPYAVDMHLVASNKIRLCALENRSRERATVDANVHGLAENLLNVCRSAIATCRGTGCWSSDAERLESLLPILHQYAE